MKKIAIMASGEGTNFQAIIEYFKNKNVKIICISDVATSNVLKRAKKSNITAIFLPFNQNEKFFNENKFDLVVLAGYMRILTAKTLRNNTFINLHPALLPAFKGKNAIERTYRKKVKVSGITIHYVDETLDGGEIIAQYPIFLNRDMNLADFEYEIHKIEHKFYPIVIENILEDKIFDFQDLIKSSCKGGCNGCKH